MALLRCDAFPGTYGEIMVTAYHGEHYIELIAEVDGKVGLVLMSELMWKCMPTSI